MQPSLVIIVPAHNEESSIGATLRSLAACAEATVVVVADNCSDKTADIARAHGVRLIIRDDPSGKGKPKAIAHSLDILVPEGFQYFAVVDADTVVEANFAAVLLELFSKGAQAIQVRYAHQAKNVAFWQRYLDISFTAKNTLMALGRQYWGLSCGILGNGFALTRETVLAVPFHTDSIVEDTIYHIRLVCSGRKVQFTMKTSVWALMPPDAKAARTQRSRWEGGRLAAVRQEAPMLCKLICIGNLRLLEPLLGILSLPLALHMLAIVLLLLMPLPFVHVYAWTALSAVLLYTFVAMYIRKEGWKDWAALCLTPFYILWKICLIPATISASKKTTWNRTEREKEKK